MAADPVTGGLTLADDVVKAGLQVDAQVNTPAMDAAKVAREIQAAISKVNLLVAAAAKGDRKALDALRIINAE